MGDLLGAVAPVLATLVSVGAATLTARAARRAAAQTRQQDSRATLEEKAFERAKDYLDETVEDQRKVIVTRDAKIRELEEKVAELEKRVADQARTIRDQGDEIHELRAELTTARNALRLRFPDET